MRFKLMFIVALATIASLFVMPAAAEAKPARTAWNGVTLQVVSTLPSNWDVKDAVMDLDWYTGSRFILVKSCSPKYRCVVISNGKTSGPEIGLQHGCISSMMVCRITIDVAKSQTPTYKRNFDSATRRWLIRHELGHYRGLKHRMACDTTMQPYNRCHGHTPPNTFTAAEIAILRKM